MGLSHYTLNLIELQIDGSQCLHSIRSTGGRGDRPRGGFRDGESRSADNGHHERCGAVARQPTDAVFIKNHGFVWPVQPLTTGHHGLGETDDFIYV